MSPLKTQFAKSLVSDFEKNTWTFEFDFSNDFSVSPGKFAIIPKDKFDRILKALSQITHWDDDLKNVFGDPSVLANEIINLIV